MIDDLCQSVPLDFKPDTYFDIVVQNWQFCSKHGHKWSYLAIIDHIVPLWVILRDFCQMLAYRATVTSPLSRLFLLELDTRDVIVLFLVNPVIFHDESEWIDSPDILIQSRQPRLPSDSLVALDYHRYFITARRSISRIRRKYSSNARGLLRDSRGT
jgi:hypothetical protein